MTRKNAAKGCPGTAAQPPRLEAVGARASDEPIDERARRNGAPIRATERYSPPADRTSGRGRAVADPNDAPSERRDEVGPV